MPDANGYWTDSDRDAVVQSIVQQLAQHHASMQQYIDVLLAAQGQDPAVQAQNRVQAWTAILGSLRRLTQTADAARTSLEEAKPCAESQLVGQTASAEIVRENRFLTSATDRSSARTDMPVLN